MILRFKYSLFILATITVLQSTAWSQIKTDGSSVDTDANTTTETPASTPAAPTPEASQMMSEGTYYGSVLIGGMLGFGSGHAVQNRWSDNGWKFSLLDLGGIGLVSAGVPLKHCFPYSWGCDESKPRQSTTQKVLMGTGFSILLGSRLWQIYDLSVAETAPAHLSNGKSVAAYGLGYGLGHGLGHAVQGRYGERGWIFTLVDLPLTGLLLTTAKGSPFRIKNGAFSSTEQSLVYVGLGGTVVSRIAQIYDIFQSGKNATDASSDPVVRMQPNLGYDDASDQLMYGFSFSY